MPLPPPSGLARAGSGFLGTLLGIALAVLGFFLMIGALLLGLAVAAGALIWSLLRGKKPQVQFQWRQASARAWRPGSGRPSTEDVVDVEVREIPDAKRPNHRPNQGPNHGSENGES